MRRKLSKLMAYLLTFCMLMSLMPATAFAILATHSHPICGATHTDIGDHTGTCENVDWTAWDGTGTPSGNVYLTDNVTLTESLIISSGTVNLCLNGHTITITNSQDAFYVESGATLNICECSTNQSGKIEKTSASADYPGILNRGGTVNVYSGTVSSSNNSNGIYNYSGTVNVYSGTVSSSQRYGINNRGTVNVYGGTVSGIYSGINNKGTVNVYGGTVSSSYSNGIYNDANLNIYGGTVCGISSGINNGADGEITVSGGTVTSEGDAGTGIYNYGEVTVSGGTVKSTGTDGNNYGIYCNTGTLNLSGAPTITGTTADINLEDGIITIDEDGLSNITPYAVKTGTDPTEDAKVKIVAANETDYSAKFAPVDKDSFTVVRESDNCLYLDIIRTVSVTGVTLDKSSINLYLGKTDNATLTASVEPDNATNKAVTWTTDDMAVATVDQNGVVTAVGKGYTKITATAADGSDVSDSLYVYVNDKIESVVINVVAPVVGNTINGNNFSVDASQPYYIHRTSWNGTLNNDDTNVTVEAGQNYKMKVVLAGNYGYFDDNTTASIKVGDDIIKEGVVLTAGATPSTCSVEYIFNIPALEYTVTFNSNGGSGTMANQTIEVGTETALSPTSFTRSGYKFSGWATSADGAKVYDDKQSVTDIAAAGESITLFAVWTEKATITISDVQQQYDYSGEPIEFNLNSPLTGFTVKYRVKDTTTWSDSIPTEVNIYDVKITRAEDADYKAYEMIFIGKLVINKALQAAPTTPAVVNETIKNKKDGKITGVTTAMEYKKQGDADYTEISGTSLEGLEADTYLVRYKETETHSAGADKELVIADGKTISATFDMDGHGTTTDGQSGKAYGDKVSEPAAPTDNDWKFIGWYKENTFVNEWDFANDTLADDTVIYAKWQEKKSVAIYEAAQTYYYDGNEKEFELSGTDAGLTGFDIQYKIDGTYGSTKPTEFGSYDVKITREYDNEYKAYSKEITRGLVIAQSGTEFTDKQILKDGTPTTTFTYGDTITVKIKPQATGQAAPMMLMSLSAPAKNQMALFYNNGTEDIQISDAAEADSDGCYTMTVNTTENLVMPTNATVSLIAKYVGNNNMADYSETLEITFNKADSSVTAPAPVENLVYNGSEQTLISAATDVVGGTVKYKLEGGEYSTELPQATNAGTYTVYYKVFGDDYHNDTTENSVSVTIAKATQSAPTTPAAVAETIKGKADGKITGVTSNMEYKKQNDENYTGITGETVENLAIGTYFVRYKEDANHFASEDAQVVIAEGVMISVSFNSNEGTAVESKTCEYNQAITAPAEPTKDGFEFIAWYLEDTLTTKWTNEYLFTVDTTLYAKWVHGTVSDHEDHVDEVEANGLNDVAKTEETDIELIVQIEEALEGDTEQTAIKAVENAPSNFGFYDIKLEKSTGGNVTDASGVIEIKLPYDFTRKTNIKVYRHHGGSPEELTQLDSRADTPYVDGKCFVDKESGCIYIYSSKFSTYAVAYDAVRSSSGGGTTRYTVKFDTDGGSKVSNKTVTRNSTLAEPTEPTKDGYTFIGWFTDEELTEKYDFNTKVTKSFTLYAKWTENKVDDTDDKTDDKTDTPDTPVWENPFTDVKTDDWYYENVEYAVENGLFNGTTETTFAPDEIITRAMMVTVLYRAEGEPEITGTTTFEDVDSNAYYAKAVVWGQQNGIIKGYSETEFAPDQNITREQIAAIMHRYAQYKEYDVSVGENTNILSYDDFDSISEYAIASMQYAVGSGLMKGKTTSTLNPLDNATRAEIAAILHRFIESNK